MKKYTLEEIMDAFEECAKQRQDLEQRLDKIKNYLKQVHYDTNHGILSSNNLIWDNIVRLCDGLEILGDKENV